MLLVPIRDLVEFELLPEHYFLHRKQLPLYFQLIVGESFEVTHFGHCEVFVDSGLLVLPNALIVGIKFLLELLVRVLRAVRHPSEV